MTTERSVVNGWHPNADAIDLADSNPCPPTSRCPDGSASARPFLPPFGEARDASADTR